MKTVLLAALRSLALPILAAFIFAVSGQAAFGQGALKAKSFEGVWKVTKVVRTGANASTNTHPQPSLTIFSRGYYTVIRDMSSEPRKPSPAAKDPMKLTDAEKVARYEEWEPFRASAGTYEVKGNTLITHNLIAKQAKGMTLTEEVTIKFEGNTFVAGGPDSDWQTTYTRVQ